MAHPAWYGVMSGALFAVLWFAFLAAFGGASVVSALASLLMGVFYGLGMGLIVPRGYQRRRAKQLGLAQPSKRKARRERERRAGW